MTTATIEHIELDDRGVAWVADANVKVIEIIQDKLAYGWSPEETHFQHPHLSMAQIHAALAYYYDHQAELDQAIEAGLQRAEAIRSAVGPSPIRAKLQAKGLVP